MWTYYGGKIYVIHRVLVVIYVYAPTSQAAPQEVDVFLQYTSSCSYWTARQCTGSDWEGAGGAIGKFGFEDCNEAGGKSIEFVC